MKNVPENLKSLHVLTNREVEIIQYIASGLNSIEIAGIFNLSSETINTHRRNILNKTRCRNMTEVAVKCALSGMVQVKGF